MENEDSAKPSEQKPSKKSIGDILYKYENWLNKDSTRPFFVREDVVKAMQEYASQERLQARNEAIQECIDLSIRLAGIDYWQDEAAKDVIGKLIERLENLKQK